MTADSDSVAALVQLSSLSGPLVVLLGIITSVFLRTFSIRHLSKVKLKKFKLAKFILADVIRGCCSLNCRHSM